MFRGEGGVVRMRDIWEGGITEPEARSVSGGGIEEVARMNGECRVY